MSGYLVVLHDAQDASPQGRAQLRGRLCQTFGFETDTIDSLLRQLPVIIRRDLSEREAQAFAAALEKLGGISEVVNAIAALDSDALSFESDEIEPLPTAVQAVNDLSEIDWPNTSDLEQQLTEELEAAGFADACQISAGEVRSPRLSALLPGKATTAELERQLTAELAAAGYPTEQPTIAFDTGTQALEQQLTEELAAAGYCVDEPAKPGNAETEDLERQLTEELRAAGFDHQLDTPDLTIEAGAPSQDGNIAHLERELERLLEADLPTEQAQPSPTAAPKQPAKSQAGTGSSWELTFDDEPESFPPGESAAAPPAQSAPNSSSTGVDLEMMSIEEELLAYSQSEVPAGPDGPFARKFEGEETGLAAGAGAAFAARGQTDVRVEPVSESVVNSTPALGLSRYAGTAAAAAGALVFAGGLGWFILGGSDEPDEHQTLVQELLQQQAGMAQQQSSSSAAAPQLKVSTWEGKWENGESNGTFEVSTVGEEAGELRFEVSFPPPPRLTPEELLSGKALPLGIQRVVAEPGMLVRSGPHQFRGKVFIYVEDNTIITRLVMPASVEARAPESLEKGLLVSICSKEDELICRPDQHVVERLKPREYHLVFSQTFDFPLKERLPKPMVRPARPVSLEVPASATPKEKTQ